MTLILLDYMLFMNACMQWLTCIYIDCNGRVRDHYEWLCGLQVVTFVYFDFQLVIYTLLHDASLANVSAQ